MSSRISKLFCLSLLLLVSAPLFAQIGLRLTADSKRFLRYEEIKVHLLVRNYSGNTLVFQGDEDRIYFKVTRGDGRDAADFDAVVNPAHELILGPGEARELTVILNSLYDMQRIGTYTVTACLSHSRLPKVHVSDPMNLEVRDGTVLISKNIGLPSANENDVIKSVRLLLMAFQDTEEAMYCLRVEDDDNVYYTGRLGMSINGDPPQMDIDGTSTVHILIQERPKIYSYLLFSFVGRSLKLRQQRYYLGVTGPPFLIRKGNRIMIQNAKLAEPGVDYKVVQPNFEGEKPTIEDANPIVL